MRGFFPKKAYRRSVQGFTLIEIIVVVAIIAVFAVVSYVGVSAFQSKTVNDRREADLQAITQALEAYQQDNGYYPYPSGNLLLTAADTSQVHDLAQAYMVQGEIDGNTLPAKYLSPVPVDPQTKHRYVYAMVVSKIEADGKSAQGKYYALAAVQKGFSGYEGRVLSNYPPNAALISIVRAYDGPQFVLNARGYLPYDPESYVVSAKARGQVTAGTAATIFLKNGTQQALSNNSEITLFEGDKIQTSGTGTVELYYSDGSFSRLDSDTHLELKQMSYKQSGGTLVDIFVSAGKVWNRVVKLESEETSEFKVQASDSAIVVRGTTFGLQVRNTGPNQGTLERVALAQGWIELQNTGGGPIRQIAENCAGIPQCVSSKNSSGNPIVYDRNGIAVTDNSFSNWLYTQKNLDNDLYLKNTMRPKVLGILSGTAATGSSQWCGTPVSGNDAPVSDPDSEKITFQIIPFETPTGQLSSVSRYIDGFEIVDLSHGTQGEIPLFRVATVINRGLFSSSAAAMVFEDAPVNLPPWVSLSSPLDFSTYKTPATITLTAQAADSDGNVTKVEFYQGTTKIGEDTNGSDGWSMVWATVPSGKYTLSVQATDNTGASTTSHPAVNVIVDQMCNFTVPKSAIVNKTVAIRGIDIKNNKSGYSLPFVITQNGSLLSTNVLGLQGGDTDSEVPVCGNGVVEKGEECDGQSGLTDPQHQTCYPPDNTATGTLNQCKIQVKPYLHSIPVLSLEAGAAIPNSLQVSYEAGTEMGLSLNFNTNAAWLNFNTSTKTFFGIAPNQPGMYQGTIFLVKSGQVLDATNVVAAVSRRACPTGLGVAVSSTPGTLTVGTPAILNVTTSGFLGTPQLYANSTLLAGTGNNYSYTPTSAGNLTVLAIGSSGAENGCTAFSTPLAVTGLPQLTVQCNATSIPGTMNVNWNAGVTGGLAPYSYTWTGDEGLNGTSPAASKTYTTAGQKNANVSVTDSQNPAVTKTATCVVTLTATPPELTFSADSMNVNHNGSTTLRWNATNASSCAASGTGWSGTKSLSGTSPTGNLIASKTYRLDCSGPGGTVNKTVTVNVGAVPLEAPTVSVTSPTSGASFSVGQTVSVKAAASDSDGSIQKVEFYLNGVLKSTATNSPYTWNWNTNSFAAGTYSLKAKAYDTQGLSAESNSVNVNLTPPVPAPDTTIPSVSIPYNNSGWIGTPQSATIDCSDSGGSGCDTNSYRVKIFSSDPGICPQNYSQYTITAPASISSRRWVCGAAKDNAGNIGYSSLVEFKVDMVGSTGGSISYPTGYQRSGVTNLTVNDGTFEDAGIHSGSRRLLVVTGSLNQTTFSCTWSSSEYVPMTIHSGIPPNITVFVNPSTCYRFKWEVQDMAGNLTQYGPSGDLRGVPDDLLYYNAGGSVLFDNNGGPVVMGSKGKIDMQLSSLPPAGTMLFQVGSGSNLIRIRLGTGSPPFQFVVGSKTVTINPSTSVDATWNNGTMTFNGVSNTYTPFTSQWTSIDTLNTTHISGIKIYK